ncbi:MAG: DUF4982 domain-containing protein [Bacteroidales bacterium]|nr:DUF4982 domain-containing protein [Bacteroidales bacterium]
MKKIYGKLLLALFLAIIASSSVFSSNWNNFNNNWRFIKGNPENAQSVNFDDSAWENVTLPHDWAITGPFNEEENGNTGKLPWKGEGWYRKSFTLNSEDQGKVVYVKFDGVMSSPQIFVNGKLAGKWDYGYSTFYVDISDFVNYGIKNSIAVYVDNRKHDSRWYPGAGIYRKVEMMVTEKVHEEIWGTYITTPVVTQSYAEMRVLSNVKNTGSEDKKVTVEAVLVSPEGIEIKSATSKERTVAAGSVIQFANWITVTRPQMWDVENPVLYTLQTNVKIDGKIIDSNETPFGFRTFEFTADDGFHLNGRRLQLRGINLHHDHGPLGAAFNKRSMERKLEIMKTMGCNAIRTSHNICAPELIELCDKMGLLVFNEAFDKYDNKADIFEDTDFYEFGERVIKNFVMRDRNNPSVFIWSVGNEMGDIQGNANFGLERLAAMLGFVKKYDITRPVTMACDQDKNVHWRHFDYYDVHAWNYSQRWEPARELDPSKSVIISESASTLSTRGFYELPLPEKPTDFTKSNQVSSYDLHAPSWAEVCDDDFMWQENDKYIAGEFVWTGFDYLGEPTPYFTSRSSYFGIVDLCGIPKDRYYLYQSYWRPGKDLIHILPHWKWEGHEGEIVPVFVYTNGDEAELFLNGKSLGKQSKKPKSDISTERYRLMWRDVVYEPGELKAVAYKAGKIIGEKVVRTAGEPYTLKLTPDRNQLEATGEDLSFILVEAYDKNGNICPLADDMINFEIKGPGEIAGVGNGNPQSHEPFVATYRKLFNGKAMLIIKTIENKPGKINVEASAEGVKSAEVSLFSKK